MSRFSALFFVGLFCCSSVHVAAEDLKSGLQEGDRCVPFHVQDVTGPRKGKSLCYACAFAKHSVINIHTTKLTEELLAVIKGVDEMVSSAAQIKGDSKHAFVVYLTEDIEAATTDLEAIAKKYELTNVPLTIYDELTGPPPYKLSKEAEVTIMMWADQKVSKNLAFANKELDEAAVKKILEIAKSHLGK